jgi:hypothetical protein
MSVYNMFVVIPTPRHNGAMDGPVGLGVLFELLVYHST